MKFNINKSKSLDKNLNDLSKPWDKDSSDTRQSLNPKGSFSSRPYDNHYKNSSVLTTDDSNNNKIKDEKQMSGFEHGVSNLRFVIFLIFEFVVVCFHLWLLLYVWLSTLNKSFFIFALQFPLLIIYFPFYVIQLLLFTFRNVYCAFA